MAARRSSLRGISLGLCIALASGLLAPRVATAQDAESLFREGSAAHDRGDLEGARAKYAAAFALAPTVSIAANLGVVEAQLGRHVEAARHLSFALARFPADGDPEKRKRMSAELSRVLGYVGELRIQAPAGARIVVDGEAIGEAPLAIPVHVGPGKRRVEALRDGAPALVREVTSAAGEAIEVDLSSAPATPLDQAATAPAPATPAERHAPRTDPVIVVGGAGVTLIGLGLGLTFTVLSSSAGSDADAATSDLLRTGSNPCLGSAPPAACNDVQSDLEARDGLRAAAVASFVAGGAAALGTVAYVVLSRALADEPPSTRGLRVTPSIAIDHQGFSASGMF